MNPMKLDVFFAFFAYGGNGGIAMQLPEITTWFSKLCLEMRDDPRVGRFAHKRFGDVPLTMERNRAVVTARDNNFDVIVMIDSDNVPDLYLNREENAKPFFWSSFDLLYERKASNVPTVVAAPYCGPPPHPTDGGMENVYVFRAEDYETRRIENGYSFEAYPRQEAARMRGIVPMAAGPTGCIMYSIDAFDLMPVGKVSQSQAMDLWREGKITKERALRLINMQSYFFYEYTTPLQTAKASTEDVTNTREIQFAGFVKHKQPVVFCNWDAWAGHYKPKCVGKPRPIGIDEINGVYREAVEEYLTREEMMDVDFVKEPQPSYEHPSLAEDGDQGEGAEVVDVGSDDFFGGEFGARDIRIMPRMLYGRKVTAVGHETPIEHLDALGRIVKVMAAKRGDQPLRIVEVGSWVGESAIAMHQHLGKAGGTIFCVDTWEGSPTDYTGYLAESIGTDALFEHFRDNVGDLYGSSIRAKRGDSVEVARLFEEPQNADIIFLDASHDYDAVIDDIHAWLPHVAEDGILCGHDFCDAFPGVQRAVKELCDGAGIIPMVAEGMSVWFVSKRDYLKGLEAKKSKAEKRESSRAGKATAEGDG